MMFYTKGHRPELRRTNAQRVGNGNGHPLQRNPWI